MTVPTAPVHLGQAIVAGGLRSVNFFNGRLLTGEDLSREQDGIRRARLRLGEVVGDGVATGLEVAEAGDASSVAAPVLRIEAGLAVNRAGEVLELPCRTDVSLARAPAAGGAEQLVFTDCDPGAGGTYTAGSGVFLLTIGPSTSPEGRATAGGLGNAEAACNIAFSVEGVQFRLLRLALPPSVVASADRLRARLVDLAFGLGEAERPRLPADPFGTVPQAWGLVDRLRARGCPTEREVPLCLLHWTATRGIRFVDLWSVRRRVTSPPVAGRFGPALDDRRAAEAEAYALAFQAQVEDLRLSAGSPSSVRALDRFERLPAAGLLPLGDARHPRGFNEIRFFDGLATSRIVHVEGQRVVALLHAALLHPPLDLAAREAIWLYRVRENVDTTRTPPASGRPYLLFAGGHVPYAGHAQFDLAHWDLANYALRLA